MNIGRVIAGLIVAASFGGACASPPASPPPALNIELGSGTASVGADGLWRTGTFDTSRFVQLYVTVTPSTGCEMNPGGNFYAVLEGLPPTTAPLHTTSYAYTYTTTDVPPTAFAAFGLLSPHGPLNECTLDWVLWAHLRHEPQTPTPSS